MSELVTEWEGKEYCKNKRIRSGVERTGEFEERKRYKRKGKCGIMKYG